MDNITSRHIESELPRTIYLSGRRRKYADLKDVKPEVLEALSNGDPTAFGEIYVHYRESLIEFIYFLVHSQEDAEEISQDVFASLWESRARVGSIKNFKNYLYQAAKNGALDIIQKRKVSERYSEFKKVTAHQYSADPEQIYRNDEIELLLKISVANMPEQQRTVFSMSRDEGLSNAEIAERLNISKHTVENHLYNAKRSLRELLTIFIFLFISQ